MNPASADFGPGNFFRAATEATLAENEEKRLFSGTVSV
jgi:hypothetical protein